MNIDRGILFLTAMLMLLPLQARFVAADREHQQIMADVRMLQEQAQQLAIAVSRLAEALKGIDERMDRQEEVNLKAFASQRSLVDNIGSNLQVIRERADETNVRLSSLEQELEAVRQSIPPPMYALPLPPAVALPRPDSGDSDLSEFPEPPDIPTVTPSVAGLSPMRMYDQAFADYGAGQWALAIEGFQAFIRTFPMSDQTDDAQYYVGETHYLSGRYEEAVNAYNQVIQRYPDSNSTPAAYFKGGLALERLGDLGGARTSWEFVLETYPDSDAGRLAKQALDRTSSNSL
tara:strand:+ start:4499 stop:5368 length:870 start_codon:yes stop_codon:yes gene_type:complete